MQSWTKEEQQDFLNHYQSVHFKENNPNSFVKCNFKRKSLNILLQTSHTVASNETSCLLLQSKLREYSSIVDKQDGVNNYANGVLDLVPNNYNDAQKWSSKAKASDLLKDFLKPMPGECHNKSPEGCKAVRPTRPELEAFLSVKKKPSPRFTEGLNKPALRPLLHQTGNSTAQTRSLTPLASVKNPTRVPPAANPQSRVMSAIETRVFGTRNGGSTNLSVPAKQSAQPALKHTPSFRTASTELKLQNVKKYGNQAGDSGVLKKSLGGRARPVNSKFVPPVKSDSQDSEESLLPGEEEVEDDRLRLIDPKLVELIRSEIMDRGPPVHWDDIAGLLYAKATIQEIVVLPMLRPDIFTGLRRPPKGILLFGPPGTGKTLIGKCIASQSNSTFFNISASSLTSKWVGEGEKMVRTLFTLARIHQPSVVFIDEIDSLLSQRTESDHDSSRRIKTEFLVQLDGAGTGEDDRILVIGATNRPQELDEAARRRLVKRLYIPLPDTPARCQIVRNLMSTERNELTEQQIELIGSLTEGYSGADMKNVCQEACLGPIRAISFTEMQRIALEQVRPVTLEDFKSALSRVRASVSQSDLECYITWDQTYGSGGAPK